MKIYDPSQGCGEFARLSPDLFDETFARLIKSDIENAQLNLNRLPESEMRGLAPETWAHFRCGWLTDWINTKNRAEWICGTRELGDDGKPKPLPPPSRRIIIPTPDMIHYNAVVPPSDRKPGDSKWCKVHQGAKSLFFDHKVLKRADVVALLEGEIDGMSLWQCSGSHFPFVSILGRNMWRKVFLPQLKDRLKGKKFILLFDKDDGQIDSVNLCDTLIRMEIPAVSMYFFDFLPDADKEFFGQKVDANKILVERGNSFLQDITQRIFDSAAQELKSVEEHIANSNLFAHDDKQPANRPVAVNRKQKSSDGINPDDKDKIPEILSYIPANKLDRNDWIAVGMVLKRYGFDFDTFKDWSSVNDTRYNEHSCKADWNSFWENSQYKSDASGHTIATLIHIAKKFGYVPRGKSSDVSQHAPAVDSAVEEWQKFNGTIAPDTLTRLTEAKAFLDALEVKDITPGVALSSKTKHYVAICKAYDCYADSAEKFFAILDAAKRKADDDIKVIKASHDEPPIELVATKNISVTEIKDAVQSLVKSYVKAHKEFVKAEEQRQAHDDAQRKIDAAQTERNDATARLKTLLKQDKTPERDAAIVDTIKQLCVWKYDKHGDPVEVAPKQENADYFFKFDPGLEGLFAYDAFQDANVFLKAPPWNKEVKKGEWWTDSDDCQLRVYLRRRYNEFNHDKIVYDTVADFSKRRRFHVVEDFFKSLPAWDGKNRAETFFIDWNRVPDTPYARAVTMNWLLGAVARIFFPGCEYQTVLVLQGAQGTGKDFNLKRLAAGWHAAITDSLDNGDAVDVLKLSWIAVFEEMYAVSKSHVNAVKSFISRNTDERREKYAKHARRIPRHCVFAITTNDKKFLNDVTGNRRYLILNCGSKQSKPVKIVRGERLTDDNTVNQIWAEVYAKFQEKFAGITDPKLVAEKLLLPDDITEQAAKVAEQHMNDNGGSDSIIEEFIDTKIPVPVIWDLLSREQRRQFFVEGSVKIDQADLNFKRRARGGRNVQEDINAIDKALNSREVRKITIGEGRELYQVFGTEYRQHICAAEILDECFDKTDKRKSPVRINELLARLEGWEQGKSLSHDPAYGRQHNVYWRIADNNPNNDEPANNPPPAKDYDDFGGTPIAPEDCPFTHEEIRNAAAPVKDLPVATVTAAAVETPVTVSAPTHGINLITLGWHDVEAKDPVYDAPPEEDFPTVDYFTAQPDAPDADDLPF